MDIKTTNTDSDVGYGKPPRHSRWKAGQSGNRNGRPKKRKLQRLGDVIAAKLAEEKKVSGDPREGKLPTLRLLLRKIVEKAATGDVRAVTAIIKISDMGDALPPPNEPDWVILTYDEGRAAHRREDLNEEFYQKQDRMVAQWYAELRKGGTSPQQMLQLELTRRVAATTPDGKKVKVPMQEIIASRLLHNAKAGDVQTFRLLLKIMPQKHYKPKYDRIEIMRPTKCDIERGAVAKPRSDA